MEVLNILIEIIDYVDTVIVEYEYHFLLVCSLNRDLRKKSTFRIFSHWPKTKKFDDFMFKTSKNVILNLLKFVYYDIRLSDSVQIM